MVINENLYQIKSSICMTNFFFTAENDDKAIEFVFEKYRDGGITINRIMLDGSRPKISLYTSKKWKELEKQKNQKK